MREKLLNTCLFFILSSLSCLSFSQGHDTSPESIGDIYFNKAVEFFSIDIDSTEQYMKLALEKYTQAENWKQAVNCYGAISNCLFKKGNYDEYFHYAKEGKRLAEKHLPEKSEERNTAISNFAVSLTQRGYFHKAIETLKVIYQNEIQQNDKNGLPLTLGEIGYNYHLVGDYEESLSYYIQSLKLWQGTTDFLRYSNEARIFNQIGNCYFEIGKLDSALVNHQKALKRLAHSSVNTNQISINVKVKVHLDLASAYLEKDDYKLTFFHIKKANDSSKDTHYYNEGLADQLLGRTYLKQKKYKQALNSFQKSKQLSKLEFATYKKHPLIAEKDIWLGKTYLRSKDYHKALVYFQSALNGLLIENIELPIQQNPNLENLFAKKIGLEALVGKAQALSFLFKKDQKVTDLELANKTYNLTAQLTQELRQEFIGKNSKQLLSESTLPIFEEGIETALKYFELTKDSIYLHQAFSFSEKNKAIILLESINENTAKITSNIPKELLEEEEKLKIEIAFRKKSINEYERQSKDYSEKIKMLKQRLFEEEKKYQLLIQKFEKEYPEYYHLKYNTQLASVDDIQNHLLSPQQSMVEYFFGEKNIYIFSITTRNLKVHKIQKEESLISAIKDLIQLISSPPSHKNQQEKFGIFTKQSFFVFENLLKESLPEDCQELIIIPDDVLNYLPFEVLLTSKYNNTIPNYSPEYLDYLLKKHPVSYSYSSTLLLNSLEQKEKNFSKEFVGIAPSFKSQKISEQRACNENQLYALHCNQDEVKRIQAILGGETLTENKATLENFNHLSKHCKILHLATHACIDNENPLFNKIHLTDDYVSNNDLYNLAIDAELTVLSACNTGSGQLAKGEGVMSLSRGFIHAGCPSVVMSLWSVDDCTTSDIMVDFYKNLKEKKTKNEALQLAKLNFLNQAKKAQQHPFYWAAFVQIGNSEELDFSNKNKAQIILSWISAILLLSFFVYIFSWKKEN